VKSCIQRKQRTDNSWNQEVAQRLYKKREGLVSAMEGKDKDLIEDSGADP
jgi:hypothetical protein